MVVVVKLKPFKDIISNLKSGEVISLVLCGICPVFCGISLNEMADLARKLRNKSFEVSELTVSADMCYFPYVRELEDLKGDVILALGCEAAVCNLEKRFPEKRVIQALDNLGLASFSGKGNVKIVKKHL